MNITSEGNNNENELQVNRNIDFKGSNSESLIQHLNDYESVPSSYESISNFAKWVLSEAHKNVNQ